MTDAIKIPLRSEIPARDRWDLGSLFAGPEEWERGLEAYKAMIPRVPGYQDSVGASSDSLLAALAFNAEFGLLD